MPDAARVVQAGETRSARVESLRALAALGVLESHAFGYSQGWAPEAIYGTYTDRLLLMPGSGVVLFFALTGYLLFLPFARRWWGSGAAVDIGRYALNRVLRIVPLYLFAVALLLILTEGGGTWEQWWRFTTLSQNYFADTVATVNGPLWSVVVEMHFYLLLPALAWGLAVASRRSLRAAAAILLALAIVSAVFRAESRDLGDDPRVWQYSLPATFYWFTSGMFLAMLRVAWGQGRPAWLRGVAASPLAWLVAAVPFWLLQADRFADWPAAVGSFFVVGACVLPLEGDRVVRLLDWRPLALLGIASYSLYVWHEPVANGLADHVDGYIPLLAATAALSIAIAAVSYCVVERPFLRLRRVWSPR